MSQLCWIICLFVASFVYYAASLRSYLTIIMHEIMSGQFYQSNLLFYHICLNIYKLLYGNINSFHHSIPHSNPYSIPKIRDTRNGLVNSIKHSLFEIRNHQRRVQFKFLFLIRRSTQVITFRFKLELVLYFMDYRLNSFTVYY